MNVGIEEVESWAFGELFESISHDGSYEQVPKDDNIFILPSLLFC